MEIWKDCKGYEGLYQVSDLGRIWSIKRQCYLKGSYDKDGYIKLTLIAKNGKIKYERAHRLIALSFIENPNSYTVVNHINGIKDDNRATNLEWTDVKGNTKHAYDNNLGGMKEIQKMATEAARLKNTKTYLIYKNGELIAEGYGILNTAEIAGCNEKTVRNCLRENRATRNGYSFAVKGGDDNAENKPNT